MLDSGAHRMASAAAVPAKGAATMGESEAAATLARALMSAIPPAVKAGVLGHRDLLLTIGTPIGCVLETKLDSTLPGLTRCRISQDVYGDTGRVVVFERGSVATGEYRSDLKQGQARLFVVWTRVVTPTGVAIALQSPAADEEGAAGISGDVDEHWFKRIGAAFLLSTIEDVIVNLSQQSQTQTSGSTVVMPNTTQTSDRMAEKVLDSTINQPPTLTRDPGALIEIMVARDLDFADVYDLIAN